MVGYGRYDNAEELAVMNQLYEVSRLFQNFFQPVMKLQRKQRIGGRIQRLYDVPQTPMSVWSPAGSSTSMHRESCAPCTNL